MDNLELNTNTETAQAQDEKGTSFESFLENLESEIDGANNEINVINLGSEMARVKRGQNFIDFKITLSYGDKQQIKALNKAESLLYDDSGDSKIEMKLRDNDIDLFILEKQVRNSNLGSLNRDSISKNETHLELFESAVEIIKLKNGLVMTKKQMEKKKTKKA